MKTRSLFSHIAATGLLAAGGLLAGPAAAQGGFVCTPGAPGHPGVQPRPTLMPPVQTATKTTVQYQEGMFPPSNPFLDPPGSNLLPNVNSNVFDGACNEVANTLPSTPDNPYNLHPDPVVTPIDPTSPTQDLDAVFQAIDESNEAGPVDLDAVRLGIDILEGNPIPDRVYSGFPLLHYTGPLKIKNADDFTLTRDAEGNVTGGNVTVRHVWYDSHIEGDTMFMEIPDELMEIPWTMRYVEDTLDRGHDDFSPFAMFFDTAATVVGPNGQKQNPPMVAFDQTFFPMEEGTRSVFDIAMPPGKYYNLTYTWGWRWHPPRVQAIENARKVRNFVPLRQFEVDVFGENPRASELTKLQAISKIGHLAPAKRMWSALQSIRFIGSLPGPANHGRQLLIRRALEEARAAFQDWKYRTKLPRGFELDPNSHVTLAYLNNTIYGQINAEVANMGVGPVRKLDEWETRPFQYKVRVYNGDHYIRGYVAVDFGGWRGWENQFQSTIPLAGSGAWFTFGRTHFMPLAGMPPFDPFIIRIDRASGLGLSSFRDIEINLNHEPSRRLRMYQFDPEHHDVAIWSFH